MYRYEPLCPLIYGKLKSKRRKIRLQKEAFDKKLLAIVREERKLFDEKYSEEPVLLEKPIRKGWQRFFMLRDDLQNRPDAEFFKSLLEKINTVQYSRNKKFKHHKRRIKKYNYALHTQSLKTISGWEFHHPTRCRLNEKEKEYFIPKYKTGTKNLYVQEYVFNQAWRFVLCIKPHWITHAREINEVREQRISEIDQYITRRNLRHKMAKLQDGYAKYRGCYAENPCYTDPLRNKPFTHYLEMYEDEIEFMVKNDHTKIEI